MQANEPFADKDSSEAGSHSVPAATLPPLATLSQRVLGVAVDVALPGIPLLLQLVLTSRPAEIGTASEGLLVFLAGCLYVLLAINIHLLLNRGQTIGKFAVQSRIVQVDGSRAGFMRIILLRGLLNGLLVLAFPVYLVIDALFIHRADRRCVHDFLAGTIVVQA